jgi:hypothetical protein
VGKDIELDTTLGYRNGFHSMNENEMNLKVDILNF